MNKTRLLAALCAQLWSLCLLAQPFVSTTDFTGHGALNYNKVTGMTTDRRGLLWVSTWGGLYRFDGYQFLSYKVRPGDGNELDNARIDDVQQDTHGNLICRSYEDYYLYDLATNKFRRLAGAKGVSEGRRRLYESGVFQREGYQLKVENNRLSYFDTTTRQWQPLVEHIKQARVTSAGIVWALMDDDRFLRILVRQRHFTPIDTDENVLALHRDRHGHIWQTNNDGSVLLRDGRSQKIGYLSPTGTISSSKSPIGRIYTIDSDAQGRIYLGTRLNGLYVLTPTSHSSRQTSGQLSFLISHYQHDPADPYSLDNDEIFSLLCDGSHVWVGTLREGLNLMTTRQGKTVFLNHRNSCTNFPSYEQLHGIRSMVRINDVIALATSDGIFTFQPDTINPEKIHFYHSQRINDNPHSLASNGSMSVNYIDGRGLFVCTSHAGLCHTTAKDLLQDDLKFETWNTEAGAPSDQTLQTFIDDDGQQWITFESGLSKLDASTMASTDFIAESTTFSWTRPVQLDDGSTIFATTRGLLKADLRTLHHQTVPLPILITALTANGKDVPYSLNADTVVLAKDQRNFTIEFAALDMAGTNHVEYAYQLEGRDRNWVKTGPHRQLSFFNLGAGTYHLLIRATDNNRTWNDRARRITIIIQPTFWETPWAWLLYGVLGIASLMLVLLVAMYIYRLRLNADFEKRMTEMKLRYFTNLSHDLRTPLTLIEGPVSEMLHDHTLTEQNRGYLSLIRHNTHRMMTLVNQILDFRKIQNGKMHLFIEQIDLKAELTEVMSDFQYLATDHHIDFALTTPSAPPASPSTFYIWGDRDKVQKIFFNLLSNAFKYTAPSGRVWIEILEDANTVSASVCDTGKGIPQHAINRLFSRFETILSDNYMQSSTGIGLSLVKELVELHHAQLTVDSKEGEGSRFQVTFQKGSEHFLSDEGAEVRKYGDTEMRKFGDETVQKHERTEVQKSNATPSKILLVEDDAEMLLFVSGILSDEYQVVQAVDGQDGQEKASREQPDLIISDINMPRMNGWQLVEALKSQPETSHIPVVLLTANGTLDDRIHGASLGVDDYIVKPFSTEYLRVRMHSILQKQHSQQQYFAEKFTHPQSTADDIMRVELPEDNAGVERRLRQMDTEIMERLRDFMEAHLTEDLAIQDLADHVGLSRTLFYNKIRSITGLSPVDFYRKYHIERAAQMLRNDGLTVSEACYNAGFSDPKYFSKVFKKFMGTTPSE